MKLTLYLSLLATHNALCFQQIFNRWTKTDKIQWNHGVELDNLHFVNESTFDEYPMPEMPFYLIIDKSWIHTLPPNTFRKCPTLLGTFLSDVDISKISPGAFEGLEKLAEIDLSKNKLTQVEDGVFNKIENLIYLNLSYNCIKNVSEQSFTGLKHLNYLYLQGNEISLLYNNLFESQVNSLLKLDISSNSLQKIDATFKGMSHLTHLFLQMNNISDVAPYSLNNLTSLEYLDVSHNNIHHIGDPGLEKLNKLFLQNNKILLLDHNLFYSQKSFFIILNMSSNGLKEINTIFHGMSVLTHLYLQGNDITTLAPDSFQNLSSLEYLDLSQNCIQALPENIFSGSGRVTHLYLYDNKITFLDSSLFESQRHSLILLNLSSNTLTELRTEFRGLRHLTSLDLHKNRVSRIAANCFQDVNSLEYLDISSNNLEQFQYGLLDHLDHLKYLNFSYNQFKEFPLEYLSYTLKELIFDNNNIKSLNGTEILHHFPSVRTIGMRHNFIWSCSQLMALVKQLRVHNIDVLQGNNFLGENVRGMSCYEDYSVSSDNGYKSDIQREDDVIKQTVDTTIEKCSDPTDKNIRELINVIMEKNGNGTMFNNFLISIIVVTLIVMACLQYLFFIKLRRNTHKEPLQLF